ncbi:tRNA-Val4 [Virgibacillus proomii]|uniref:tRNA-Val4 n=1 Tax=Virgibacillus proomii TaxID=84407 RepID=UPI001C111BAB|nr:tRNA-Val4 [Virgibacillus proomii]
MFLNKDGTIAIANPKYNEEKEVIEEMKYKFSFYKDPLGTLRIKLPEEVDMFSDFIEQIATEELANEIIGSIDSVQKEEKVEEEIMINAPTVVIKSEITSVSLADILDDPPPKEYMETKEFCKLILAWKDKLLERRSNCEGTY